LPRDAWAAQGGPQLHLGRDDLDVWAEDGRSSEIVSLA
jgi:hypothetical protein